VATAVCGSLAGCSGHIPGTEPDQIDTETTVENERVLWRYPPREGDTEGTGYAAVEVEQVIQREYSTPLLRFNFNSTVGGLASNEPYKGYRPEHWFRKGNAKSATLKRVGVLVAAILVLSAFLGGVTLDSYQQATVEAEIQDRVGEAVESPLLVINIDIEESNTVIFREPSHVIITIGVPPDAVQPQLAARLDRITDDAAGEDVETSVRYITVERDG